MSVDVRTIYGYVQWCELVTWLYPLFPDLGKQHWCVITHNNALLCARVILSLGFAAPGMFKKMFSTFSVSYIYRHYSAWCICTSLQLNTKCTQARTAPKWTKCVLNPLARIGGDNGLKLCLYCVQARFFFSAFFSDVGSVFTFTRTLMTGPYRKPKHRLIRHQA